MEQEESTKELIHDEKVQIIFKAVEQLYEANKKPTEATIWVLVKNSGVTKEDIHNYTWHLRGEQING